MAAEKNEKPQRAAEVLEIEDEEQRQERMHSLLARLNSNVSAPVPRLFEFRDRSTLPAGPPLHLLSRIQAFLPELAASNEDLLRRARENPESVDIESIGQDQEQYIEMDLGVGVFEHHGELPPGIPVADVDFDVKMNHSDSSSNSESDSDESSSDSNSGEESSSGSGSDSDVDIVVSSVQEKKARPKKPLPKRKTSAGGVKPDIVVLSETVDDSPTK